jgi:CDP-4-dehydro-6-deoxyglucose reductase
MLSRSTCIFITIEDTMGFIITLQPGNHIFTAEAGETILEAARRHGHQLPYGCNDGACGMCKGNVLHGTVDHGKSTEIGLPAEDREAGMALFCSAKPTSDLVIERRETSSDWDMLDWDANADYLGDGGGGEG